MVSVRCRHKSSRPGCRDAIDGVHTDSRLKEDCFARVKVLLQEGRLVLPRHPSLLMQLSALEYEFSDAGVLRIAVPERAGHDDLAMALCLAVRADPKFGVVRPSGRAVVASGPRRQVGKPNPSARSVRRSDRPTLTFLDGRRVPLPRKRSESDLAAAGLPSLRHDDDHEDLHDQ